MSANAKSSKEQDEKEIRRILSDYARSIERKDLDGITRDVEKDVLLFDLIPPFETRGIDAYRANWAGCMPYMPKQMEVRQEKMEITVGGDLAVAAFYTRMLAVGEESPGGQSWMRVTVCLRRTPNGWRSFHEHISQPMNPMDNKIIMLDDLKDAATPVDWSACGGPGNGESGMGNGGG